MRKKQSSKIFLIFVALNGQSLIGRCDAFLAHVPTSLAIPKKVNKKAQIHMTTNDNTNPKPTPISDGLTLAIWSLPLDAIVIHYGGWNHFWSSLNQMKAYSSPDDFSAAVKFWLLGALSHPLADAAFGISEFMHASPGPRLAGLIPFSFILVIGLAGVALFQWDRMRQLAVSSTLALLLAYIGAGLDGNMPADYNLQLDDAFKGQIVKGCPAPESIQTASVQSFSYAKDYGGRWYWHEVHDWTQFHQMYDNTLDILLTPKGYINTLTIKGPSPDSAPLSWDKSPLLNGIRYSWQGSTSDKKSVSMESGFGVSFPNYIVDVSPNAQELVQFQCIEVGGVRMYEGIDFMSRSPEMSEAQLDAMHARVAKQLNPYGASSEQMHRIQRSTTGSSASKTTTNNEWQKLWKALQIDHYLDQSLKD